MFRPEETIVALATPPGRGGLAVVRLSGRRAIAIAESVFHPTTHLVPRRATVVRVVGKDPASGLEVPDQAVACSFPGPDSYTGEDLVEVSVHGSPVIASAVVTAVVAAGARQAQPGEFTLRAFLSGRMDLTQAEAVKDLADATTAIQSRLAFDQLEGGLGGRIADIESAIFDLSVLLEASVDFPGEEYRFIDPAEIAGRIVELRARVEGLVAEGRRGRLLREGATVVVIGRPNVGKSSVFNRLSGTDRAIVTAVPGTTRDLLVEKVGLGGVQVTLVDTAGQRESLDPVEREGVARAEKAARSADGCVVVVDATTWCCQGAGEAESAGCEDLRLLGLAAGRPIIVAVNKVDLVGGTDGWKAGGAVRFADALAGIRLEAGDSGGVRPVGDQRRVVAISALSGEGLEELGSAVATLAGSGGGRDELPALSNARHLRLLGLVVETLRRTEETLQGGSCRVPEEFVLSDLQEARAVLEEVTGRRTSRDVLDAIFSQFCIGK